MKKCEKCKNYDSVKQGCLYMDADCKNGEMFEPITNYDRIKSMSVEKMADKLEHLNDYMNTVLDLFAASTMDLDAKDFIKEWLLQEVSENDR